MGFFLQSVQFNFTIGPNKNLLKNIKNGEVRFEIVQNK